MGFNVVYEVVLMWIIFGNGVVVKGVIVSLMKLDVVWVGVEIFDVYGFGDLFM